VKGEVIWLRILFYFTVIIKAFRLFIGNLDNHICIAYNNPVHHLSIMKYGLYRKKLSNKTKQILLGFSFVLLSKVIFQ
jgi:hypothetical protein